MWLRERTVWFTVVTIVSDNSPWSQLWKGEGENSLVFCASYVWRISNMTKPVWMWTQTAFDSSLKRWLWGWKVWATTLATVHSVDSTPTALDSSLKCGCGREEFGKLQWQQSTPTAFDTSLRMWLCNSVVWTLCANNICQQWNSSYGGDQCATHGFT